MDIKWENAFPQAPDSFHDKVAGTLMHLPEEEEKTMKTIKITKKPTWKKAVIAIAAATMVLGTTVFAGGKIAGYIGYVDTKGGYTELPSSEKVEKDFGFAPKLTGAFANGYAFVKANGGEKSATDAQGNKLDTVKELDVEYQKGSAKVTLFANPQIEGEAQTDLEDGIGEISRETVGGVPVTYTAYTNKSVGVNYQLTEQDKADEASGKLVFSYGGDMEKPVIQEVQSVSWSEDGINYSLLHMDSALSKAELVGMAGELIGK